MNTKSQKVLEIAVSRNQATEGWNVEVRPESVLETMQTREEQAVLYEAVAKAVAAEAERLSQPPPDTNLYGEVIGD